MRTPKQLFEKWLMPYLALMLPATLTLVMGYLGAIAVATQIGFIAFLGMVALGSILYNGFIFGLKMAGVGETCEYTAIKPASVKTNKKNETVVKSGYTLKNIFHLDESKLGDSGINKDLFPLGIIFPLGILSVFVNGVTFAALMEVAPTAYALSFTVASTVFPISLVVAGALVALPVLGLITYIGAKVIENIQQSLQDAKEAKQNYQNRRDVEGDLTLLDSDNLYVDPKDFEENVEPEKTDESQKSPMGSGVKSVLKSLFICGA